MHRARPACPLVAPHPAPAPAPRGARQRRPLGGEPTRLPTARLLVASLLALGATAACEDSDGRGAVQDGAVQDSALNDGATVSDAAATDGAPSAWPEPTVAITRTEARTPCAEVVPTRRALYGDLHVHTGFSFDAHAYENRLSPEDAYRFAAGEAVTLAPLEAPRSVRLDRPLDFVAVTDHGDLLGEVAICTTPGAEGHDSERCGRYRTPNGAFDFGTFMAAPTPRRDEGICGADGARCVAAARERWKAMQAAAETHYDREATCRLTTFVGHEYTNTRNVSNLHRNVIFRNATVPPSPIGYFEAPRAEDLWQQLSEQCLDAGTGCDVLVLPHNSNLSNGQLFHPGDPAAEPLAVQRARARLRARLEPVVEIFQHKGDSECRAGFPGVATEAACEFEKLRAAGAPVCAEDRPGSGGMRLWGCVHRLDFVRNVLSTGLAEQRRLGINPYRLGFIGSTDTHNGTPGHVPVEDFPGHIGVVDDTPVERLGEGNATHDGVINNPGGLAGVWAVENSRDAVFEAIRRRETFATSGPRLKIRLFGARADAPGPDLAGWCDDPQRLQRAYAQGAPMGGTLPPGAGAPVLLVEAEADGAGAGTPLSRLEIVKGTLGPDGALQQQVVTVAEAPTATGSDAETCAAPPPGPQRLCAAWRDPDPPAPGAPAFYYARVLEVPTCRWSQRTCLALPAAERPAVCQDPAVPRLVQHRAWASPIQAMDDDPNVD